MRSGPLITLMTRKTLAYARGIALDGCTLGSDDPLPAQSGEFEVQQQSKFETRYREIAAHLSDVAVIEIHHYLGIHNHEVVDDEIWLQGSDQLLVVVHGEALLLFNAMSAAEKLD